MKVGFLQYDVIWRDREANLAYIESKLKGATFDYLVLPEFFTHGYAVDSKEELLPFAEVLSDSPTIAFLTALMKEHNAYITGSIPELEGSKIYNTAIVVGPEGLSASYRKIHLPDYEKRFYTAGNETATVQCKDALIGLTVCFDIWFAPLTAKLKTENMDIISNSSCFGGEVTPTIIPIRALENQCFIINCNRIGTEYFEGEAEAYRGESQIVSPDGKVLVKADNQELLAIVDIDLSEVNKPLFGSQISSDFSAEHHKYQIDI